MVLNPGGREESSLLRGKHVQKVAGGREKEGGREGKEGEDGHQKTDPREDLRRLTPARCSVTV